MALAQPTLGPGDVPYLPVGFSELSQLQPEEGLGQVKYPSQNLILSGLKNHDLLCPWGDRKR